MSITLIPTDDTPTFKSVSFKDKSILKSARTFDYDTVFRKKQRVEGDGTYERDLYVNRDLYVTGQLKVNGSSINESYVDNQTGWGLPEWTFKGSHYNKSSDSLIVKIANIESDYVTNGALDSTITSYAMTDGSRYLISYPSLTFSSYEKIGGNTYLYTSPVTATAASSHFIIRENSFKIQNSDINIGRVLTCIDNDGSVSWRDVEIDSSTIQNINTTIGPTISTPSFSVTDTGIGNIYTARGFYFFPNCSGTGLNQAIIADTQAIVLAVGIGSYFPLDFDAPQHVICPFSRGAESIVMRPATNSAGTNGFTRINGGTENETDQFILLDNNGITIHPKQSTPNVDIPAGKVLTTNSSGHAEWLDPTTVIIPTDLELNTLEANSISSTNLTLTNSFLTEHEVSSAPTVTFYGTKLYNALTSTPNRNTNIPFITSGNTNGGKILSFNYNGFQHPIQLNIPMYIKQRWGYLESITSNDEEMNIWYKLTKQTYSIYKNSVLIETVVVNYSTCAYVFHDRKYVDTLYHFEVQQSSTNTKFDNTIFIGQIPFIYKPPSGTVNGDLFEIYLSVEGEWRNEGEFMVSTGSLEITIEDVNPNTRLIYEVSKQYMQGIVVSLIFSNEPYIDQRQFSSVRFGCTIGEVDGVLATLNSYNYQPSSVLTTCYNENDFLSYNQNYVSTSELITEEITVKKDIFAPWGTFKGCGIAGRQGYGTTSNYTTHYQNRDGTVTLGSYNNWGSIFNFYWTIDGKIEIWVDYTKVSVLTPNFCDHRLKDNIQSLDPVLPIIQQIPIFKYSLKETGAVPGSNNHIGVFAHILKNSFPQLDHIVNGDYSNTEQGDFQSINNNELVFVLMKGIQELAEKISSLENEITLIKSKLV